MRRERDSIQIGASHSVESSASRIQREVRGTAYLLHRSPAVVAAVVLVAAGCGGNDGSLRQASASTAEELRFPSYLDQTYTDGTVSLRYPRGWSENETATFGRVVSATSDAYAAFVGIRYLSSRAWQSPRQFADVAKRTLRPPKGDGIEVRYAQAASIGGRTGAEALVVWSVDGRPYALMRLFGIELSSGKVALITFATENDERHAATFGWIKKSVTWE